MNQYIKPSPGVVSRTQSNQSDWKIKMQEIDKFNSEFIRLSPIMTEFEKIKTKEIRDGQRNQFFQVITAGAIGEWNAALNTLSKSMLKIQAANAAEVNRWDAGKLNQNIALMQTRINGIIAQGSNPLSGQSMFDGLQALRSEAKRSGDDLLVRAFAEAAQNVNVSDLPDTEKGRIFGLLKSSIREMAELRKTPEQAQAIAEAEQNYEVVMQAKETMLQASAVLGEDATIPFSPSWAIPHLRRLQTNDKGEIEILPPDDPRTLGINYSKLMESEG